MNPEETRRATRVRRHLGPNAGPALEAWAWDCLGLPPQQISIRLTGWSRNIETACRDENAVVPLQGRGPQACVLAINGALARFVGAAALRATSSGHWARPTQRVSDYEWGLLAFALSWLLGQLATITDWAVCARAQTEATLHGMDAPCVAQFDVRVGHATGTAWLIGDQVTLDGLGEADAAASWGNIGRLNGMHIPVAIEVARAPLELSEAAALAVGDVVVSPCFPRAIDANTPLHLTVGRGTMAAVVETAPESTKLRIAGPFRKGPSEMDQNQQPPPFDPTAETQPMAEALTTDVVLELGRVSLPVAQVLQLGVGDVIPSDRPLGAPLDIRVGAKLIGRGELVQVNDEMGLRITELFDR